jgi:hypothetical protein
MRIDLIDLDRIPESNELSFLLGEDIFEYYSIICKNIVSSFTPDVERWANGGRRGKYYHGYIIDKEAISINLFLISNKDLKQLTCNFHFQKRIFMKIMKQKLHFSKKGQEAINSCIDLHEIYPSGYDLEFRLKSEIGNNVIFDDIMFAINTIINK